MVKHNFSYFINVIFFLSFLHLFPLQQFVCKKVWNWLFDLTFDWSEVRRQPNFMRNLFKMMNICVGGIVWFRGIYLCAFLEEPSQVSVRKLIFVIVKHFKFNFAKSLFSKNKKFKFMQAVFLNKLTQKQKDNKLNSICVIAKRKWRRHYPRISSSLLYVQQDPDFNCIFKKRLFFHLLLSLNSIDFHFI